MDEMGFYHHVSLGALIAHFGNPSRTNPEVKGVKDWVSSIIMASTSKSCSPVHIKHPHCVVRCGLKYV